MLDPETIKELIEIFRTELDELQQLMLSNLDKLRSSLDNKEAIEEVYRAAHTIKGSSKSLSLNKVGDVAEELEAQYAKWRHDEEQPTVEVIDCCIEKAKSLKTLLEADG